MQFCQSDTALGHGHCQTLPVQIVPPGQGVLGTVQDHGEVGHGATQRQCLGLKVAQGNGSRAARPAAGNLGQQYRRKVGGKPRQRQPLQGKIQLPAAGAEIQATLCFQIGDLVDLQPQGQWAGPLCGPAEVA